MSLHLKGNEKALFSIWVDFRREPAVFWAHHCVTCEVTGFASFHLSPIRQDDCGQQCGLDKLWVNPARFSRSVFQSHQSLGNPGQLVYPLFVTCLGRQHANQRTVPVSPSPNTTAGEEEAVAGVILTWSWTSSSHSSNCMIRSKGRKSASLKWK